MKKYDIWNFLFHKSNKVPRRYQRKVFINGQFAFQVANSGHKHRLQLWIDCHLCRISSCAVVSSVQSVICAACHLCSLSFMQYVICAACHLCSSQINTNSAVCHLCSLSLLQYVICAVCHLCSLSFMQSVTTAQMTDCTTFFPALLTSCTLVSLPQLCNIL